MTALFLLVPLALVVSAAAVLGFVWSVKRGQMDDLSTPAMRMLEDDERSAEKAVRPPEAQGEGRAS